MTGTAAWSIAVLDASPDAVLVVNQDGCIEMASPAVEHLFGYAPDELVGEPVERLIPKELLEAHRRHREEYAAHPVARSMGSGLNLHGRRRDGTSFPVDVSLAPVVLDGSRLVGAFVRDATTRRRNEDLLRAVNDISQQLLAEPNAEESLALTASRARLLIGATAAWVVVPQQFGPLVVAAADGAGTDALVGAELGEASLSARAMADGVTTPVADMASDNAVLAEARRLGLGPGLYLPMRAQNGPIGVLVVARPAGSTTFDPVETRSMEVFAAAAAIVVSLGQARRELEQLSLVAEHERIARDLHDTVIQRLFALGMSLQGLQLMTSGRIAERLESAVDTIDQVIREIRETIFELNKPDFGGPDVRQRLRDVATEAADHLGFAPRLAFRGPVEAAISEDLLSDLAAVTREALSNIARHAAATTAEVVVAANQGWVTLTVADDGRGIPDGPAAGNGLTNMENRATRHGGEVHVGRRSPNGTVVEWRALSHQV